MKAKELVRLLEKAGYKERIIVKGSKYSDLKYSIRILSNGDGTYSVEVPKLPGCYSSGRTKEECISNIVEAIELHLEDKSNVPDEDQIPGIEVVEDSPRLEDYLISLPQACKLLDISDATIRRYIKDRKIPAYNFGKEYKFKVEELIKFIDSKRVVLEKNEKPSKQRKVS
jgi:excisionase family DNA binding protein